MKQEHEIIRILRIFILPYFIGFTLMQGSLNSSRTWLLVGIIVTVIDLVLWIIKYKRDNKGI